MSNITGFLKLMIGLQQSRTTAYSSATQTFSQIKYDVASGTAASSMDLLYSATRTLAASATEDLDLSGTLTDTLGQTCVFADVRMICIVAAAGNTNNVLVGGAASNQFINWVGNSSDIVVVKPGGVLLPLRSDRSGLCCYGWNRRLVENCKQRRNNWRNL